MNRTLNPLPRAARHSWLLILALGLGGGCSETALPENTAGMSGTGGSSGAVGVAGNGGATGGSPSPATGGSSPTGGAPPVTSGGVSGSSTGGAATGGAVTTGGAPVSTGGTVNAGAGGSAGGATAGSAGASGSAGQTNSAGADSGVYPAPPLEMNPGARSACEANGSGFMCAQSMVFSPQMIQAAKDDWNAADPPFVYGVVGHDPDPNGVDAPSSNYASTCCQCYQLVFKGPRDGAVSVPAPKPMIVQAFNTYAGGPKAFDVYMAVGGHGNFNGCTENGRQYSMYPDTGGDWSGGVRATRYSQCSAGQGYSADSIGSMQCQNHVASQCMQIQAPEPVQSISRQSCVETNKLATHYHMNWNVVVKRVECPDNLTRVTGCRLKDQGLPAADPMIDSVGEAMSNGFRDSDYHTTTMQDCCRPTCAWPDNTENTESPYDLFYSCDREGTPYTQ